MNENGMINDDDSKNARDATKSCGGPGSEEDDPVIQRIPVYIANNMNAYLLQYPVRPTSMSYDGNDVRKLLFRPKHKQIEMHLGIETGIENYDDSRGEQIALNVDGDKGAKSSNSTFKSGKVDFQVLAGGKAVDDCQRYAVGIINKGNLHLTQVKGVLTVRPDLGYLDKSDKRAKLEGRTNDPDDDLVEPKLEAVTVKFSKGEQENKRKDKSYQSMKNKEDDEPWVNLRFNQLRSAKWADESENLICDAIDKKISLNISPENYLDSLK